MVSADNPSVRKVASGQGVEQQLVLLNAHAKLGRYLLWKPK